MTEPQTPGEAIRAAAERLVTQRETTYAQSEELAQERQRATAQAGEAVPPPAQS